MTVADTLRDAEWAAREYAVCLSHDEDSARRRGDGELARSLHARADAAGRLADDLHQLSPDLIDGTGHTIHEVRALLAEVGWRVEQLVPGRRAAAWSPNEPVKLHHVAVNRVVAYLRVSTDRQTDGFGLDVQEAAVRMWARKHKARIVAVIRDEGYSGAIDKVGVINRPGVAEALGHVGAGRADAVVVPRLDRLSRDLVVQEWLRAEFLDAGGELRSASEHEDRVLVGDPDDPSGTLIRQVLGAVVQYERSMIALRMAAGKARKREAGGYVGGQPPYGFRAVGHELVANLDEQRHVQRMKRWRREGKSLREIAARLNVEGVAPRRGDRWHAQTVQRVVERQLRNAS